MSDATPLLALLVETAPAGPTTHSFSIVAGLPFGVTSWRGYKQADSRGAEQGTIDNQAFKTPDGVDRMFQFFIAMSPTTGRIELTDLTPEAQFPDRIKIERGGTETVWGNRTGYADRFGAQADYSRVSGAANVFTILSTSLASTVTLEWD